MKNLNKSMYDPCIYMADSGQFTTSTFVMWYGDRAILKNKDGFYFSMSRDRILS